MFHDGRTILTMLHPGARGAFDPVLGKTDVTSGATNFEFVMGTTVSAYLDGSTYRIWYRADNSVSGARGSAAGMKGRPTRLDCPTHRGEAVSISRGTSANSGSLGLAATARAKVHGVAARPLAFGLNGTSVSGPVEV